jgi:hypothetical protein
VLQVFSIPISSVRMPPREVVWLRARGQRWAGNSFEGGLSGGIGQGHQLGGEIGHGAGWCTSMAGRRTHRRWMLGDYLDAEHLGNSSSATTSMPRRTEHLDGGRARTPQQRRRGNYFDAEHLANISSTTTSMPWVMMWNFKISHIFDNFVLCYEKSNT